MEKDRSSRVVAVIALVIAVMGMSIGFAAFSNTLTIEPTASYTVQDGVLDVRFVGVTSGAPDNNKTEVVPTTAGGTTETPVVGGKATIDNGNTNGPVIKDLSATFTDKGQSVTYDFYVYNAGSYNAYRKFVRFATLPDNTNSKPNIKCKAPEGVTFTDEQAAYVARACKGIDVTVTVGGDVATDLVNSYSNKMLPYEDDSATEADDRYETVRVVISYDGDESVVNALDNFVVEIGKITIDYNSSN